MLSGDSSDSQSFRRCRETCTKFYHLTLEIPIVSNTTTATRTIPATKAIMEAVTLRLLSKGEACGKRFSLNLQIIQNPVVDVGAAATNQAAKISDHQSRPARLSGGWANPV
jgi:hypothetical protein